MFAPQDACIQGATLRAGGARWTPTVLPHSATSARRGPGVITLPLTTPNPTYFDKARMRDLSKLKTDPTSLFYTRF
jgi:hypothetical protein